jgi:hypothetical protein
MIEEEKKDIKQKKERKEPRRKFLRYNPEAIAQVNIDSEEKWAESEEKDRLFIEQHKLDPTKFKRPKGGLR